MTELNPNSVAPAKRSRTPLIALGIVAVVGLAAGVYFYVTGRDRASTNDAYVDGNIVRLTPQVSGTVVAIDAAETQFVRQGQVLVQLDRHDNEIALEQAKATLAQTVRTVDQLFANEQRDAAATRTQETALKQAEEDLTRDRSLAEVHGVSAELLRHDEFSVRTAHAALDQARATLAGSRSAVTGTTLERHPQVLQAEANVRSAWLAAARTTIMAPVSGYVVRRSVQLGQQVTSGTELLAIAPLESVWVDANFKENQLSDLRIGQSATVTADIYGTRVEYHGKVLGLTAGTGSALAVLPAQNATGNWIKIVQRLPVRIGLDPHELAGHPLFIGLSTTVHVETGDHRGSALSEQPVWRAAAGTDVYATQDRGVEEAIHEIVSRNARNSAAVTVAALP